MKKELIKSTIHRVGSNEENSRWQYIDGLLRQITSYEILRDMQLVFCEMALKWLEEERQAEDYRQCAVIHTYLLCAAHIHKKATEYFFPDASATDRKEVYFYIEERLKQIIRDEHQQAI
jgi:hypothetical protein